MAVTGVGRGATEAARAEGWIQRGSERVGRMWEKEKQRWQQPSSSGVRLASSRLQAEAAPVGPLLASDPPWMCWEAPGPLNLVLAVEDAGRLASEKVSEQAMGGCGGRTFMIHGLCI